MPIFICIGFMSNDLQGHSTHVRFGHLQASSANAMSVALKAQFGPNMTNAPLSQNAKGMHVRHEVGKPRLLV